MDVGEIIRNPRHYIDTVTGEAKPKFFLILGFTTSGDLIVRVLTSRQHGRPKQPPCFHGDPYPGFYFGVVGGLLSTDTWLDLRSHPDLEATAVGQKLQSGVLETVMILGGPMLAAAMDCAARAADTTRYQEQAILDALARMRS